MVLAVEMLRECHPRSLRHPTQGRIHENQSMRHAKWVCHRENRSSLYSRLLEGPQVLNYGVHRCRIEKVLHRGLPHPDRIHHAFAMADNVL